MLSDVHRVFAIDALASSHPLSSKEEDIQTPAQISELFDAISYSKVTSYTQAQNNSTFPISDPNINPPFQHLKFVCSSSGSICSEDAVGFPNWRRLHNGTQGKDFM